MVSNAIKKLSLFTLIVFLLGSSMSADAQFWSKKQNTLLADEDAFGVTAFIDGDQLHVQWSVAEDYYMYRDQFGVKADTPGFEFGTLEFPKGQIEQDPEFGEVEVYFFNVAFTAPIISLPKSGSELNLTLLGQGCNKPVGVCYQPQTRSIKIPFIAGSLPLANSVPSDGLPNKPTIRSAQNTSDTAFFAKPETSNKSVWAYILAAFGAGILLSFTPCVLPMIPILAGVIGGQQNPSKLRSGWLAVCYVAGTVVTYAIAGWLAGASGMQLQAQFQSPLAIGIICSLLILLAISLFGAFKIQLPSALQTKLSSTSSKSSSESLSSFVLGLISALIVGACVSPVLILTLGAAITQGDPLLGAAIMSAMASGMGLLLIIFGFGAGWILPKTGAWMNQIQVLFGFMVLGVAIFIASFNNSVPSMYLWAALLLWSSVYLWHMTSQMRFELLSTGLKALAIAMGAWGVMALIGGSTGSQQILKPLVNVTSSKVSQNIQLAFNKVTTLEQAKELLNQAQVKQQKVLVDFYADWCLDCVRMLQTTYTEERVHLALKDWLLIKADVTVTNENSESLKQFFDVFGPPATLFIKEDGTEFSDLRKYGYMSQTEFLATLDQTNN